LEWRTKDFDPAGADSLRERKRERESEKKVAG
jgi:hypothetical protein